MVLKSKEYWENTVKKIGFWNSENYFYELGKNKEKSPSKPSNNPSQSGNKNHWTKILLICLPIVIIALFCFLIVKWTSGKRK
jgi:hypothetical protein